MYPTITLVNLQTYLISKGESMIDESGYKNTSEVLKIIAELWEDADKDEQKYIENLIAGTEYSKTNSK